MGILHEGICKLMISCRILPRTMNVSGESCRDNQNINFSFNIFSFRKSCHLWDNVEKHCKAGQATDDNMAQHMACWITKATNTHSEYVTRVAILQQQQSRECTSMLRYTYIARLFIPLFWPLMTSSGELGWDYETDKWVSPPLFLWWRSHSAQSSSVFPSVQLIVFLLYIMNANPPPHSKKFPLPYD